MSAVRPADRHGTPVRYKREKAIRFFWHRIIDAEQAVIGTPFYVMDFLEGRIFRETALPAQTLKERSAIYDELNAFLATLHRVDYEAVSLSNFGPPNGYFERQISRWVKQYRAAETETIPAMEQLFAELPTGIPADVSVSITHCD